jgi:ATP adenylyltransferase
MDMLFSPWRSNYINSFKDKKDDCECVFCSVQKDSAASENDLIVRRSVHTYTMLNLFPYNSGHLLIMPYRHICDFLELTEPEINEMMSESRIMIKALNEVMKPHGFNMGLNIGKAAGAGIDSHLHLHLVPRWNGDTNFMPAIGEVKVISQDLTDLKNNLIEVLKKF